MSTRDEAARWFSVLHRGVMTLQEHDDYERWIAVRANRTALTHMERLWAGLDTPRPGRSRTMMVAAICAASLGLAILSWSGGSGNSGFWTSLDWADR